MDEEWGPNHHGEDQDAGQLFWGHPGTPELEGGASEDDQSDLSEDDRHIAQRASEEGLSNPEEPGLLRDIEATPCRVIWRPRVTLAARLPVESIAKGGSVNNLLSVHVAAPTFVGAGDKNAADAKSRSSWLPVSASHRAAGAPLYTINRS
jgi:hypothetical protein